MTSKEWLNRDYSKYPEELESINNHRIFTKVKEIENGEIVCTFRFGDEVYGTKIVLNLGSKEEVQKEYLDRGVDLAYELFKERVFKLQLRFMKPDIEFLINNLFNVSSEYFGKFSINEVSYTPKINFFRKSYKISKWKKNKAGNRMFEFSSVEDIINEIKEDYYNNQKTYIFSNNRIKAAFCQLLDYLNKDNETE